MNSPIIETQKLVTVFRKIENGEIRVPAFQRSFAWDSENVLKLLESIYKGYPIGTFVFLWSQDMIFKTASSEFTGFPDIPERAPVNYIIDGFQRLSSLYNCFHWKSPAEQSKFNVIFDLDKKQFLNYSKENLPGNYIYLSSLFSPTAFFDIQRRFMNAENAERLVSTATNLHSKFQEYEIMVMTISSSVIDDIISIFEVLNNTGTRLTSEDLFRAESLRSDLALHTADEN